MEKKRLTIFFSVLAVACLFLAAAIVLLIIMPKDSILQKPQGNAAEPTAVQETALPELAEPTQPATPLEAARPDSTTGDRQPTSPQGATESKTTAAKAPEELVNKLKMTGSSAQTLSDCGCRQLVTVTSAGSTATIDFYTLENNEWKKDDSMTCSGFVGENGVTEDMYEGARATPKGLFTVGEAFYMDEKPATGLQTFQITENTYWVDDPDSKYYNQRVEGTQDKDWDSAEHLIEITPFYRYGFVIGYNTACEPYKGSAIFFHVKTVPTLGCVATQEENVLQYLKKLDASQNPYILIV